MKILIKKVDGLELPKRGKPNDAAYDVVATSEPQIFGVKFERFLDGVNAWQKIDYIEYHTNLFLSPQDEIDGDIKGGFGTIIQYHLEGAARSSICYKNLMLANGIATIDHSYRGEVCFRFKYIMQPEDLLVVPEMGRNRIYCVVNPSNVYQKGDRIIQVKAQPNLDIDFEIVETLDETARGSGGFGHTG